MKKIRIEDSFWTKDRVIREAKEYKSRTGFRNLSKDAYRAGLAGGWLDEACQHMSSSGMEKQVS